MTVDELPKFTPTLTSGGSILGMTGSSADTNDGFTSAGSTGLWGGVNKKLDTLTTIGGGNSHQNLPPSKAVYAWIRSA